MAAAAILDFVKLRFLRRAWAHSHHIWYAAAERHPVVKSIAKINHFCKNKMVAAAILDFGETTIA